MAVAKENGYPTKGLSRIMTGMCGGISRTNGHCGALLGGIAAIGLLFGRDEPEDDKTPSYTLSYHFSKRFKELFESTDCCGILPCDISTQEGTEIFQIEDYGRKICPGIAGRSAGMLQSLINEKNELSHPLI